MAKWISFLASPDYTISRALVLCNNREVRTVKGITYLPIYYSMFIGEKI